MLLRSVDSARGAEGTLGSQLGSTGHDSPISHGEGCDGVAPGVTQDVFFRILSRCEVRANAAVVEFEGWGGGGEGG